MSERRRAVDPDSLAAIGIYRRHIIASVLAVGVVVVGAEIASHQGENRSLVPVVSSVPNQQPDSVLPVADIAGQTVSKP